MSLAQDRGHCLRNLVRLMCCDGKITEPEKRFLAKVAHELNAKVRDWPAFVKETLADPRALGAVCFHAVEQTEATLARGRRLLEVTGDKSVAVLTRFQGRQVQYLLETGLTRCVIEPLYPRDLRQIVGED